MSAQRLKAITYLRTVLERREALHAPRRDLRRQLVLLVARELAAELRKRRGVAP